MGAPPPETPSKGRPAATASPPLEEGAQRLRGDFTSCGVLVEERQGAVACRHGRRLVIAAALVAVEAMVGGVDVPLGTRLCAGSGLHAVLRDPVVALAKVSREGHAGLARGFVGAGHAAAI